VGILFLCSGVTYGHGGGVDSTGGHYNKKTDEYHCHKEPVFLITKKYKEEFKEESAMNTVLAGCY